MSTLLQTRKTNHI